MEQPLAFENWVLERLNTGGSVKRFLTIAVELVADAIHLLIIQAFRKDDYAVKYAVEPLLLGDGPLGELSVRLKLVYGLGMINRNEYEDCVRLMALVEGLDCHGSVCCFIEASILDAFSKLHCVTLLPPCPRMESDETTLNDMQQQRYQQVVRSTMVLALTTLITQIGQKQAFKK